MENNNEEPRLSDEALKRLADVVYTCLRKSAADLAVTNSWIKKFDATLLETHKERGRMSTFGLFSDILNEVQEGVDVVKEIGTLDVRSDKLRRFLWNERKVSFKDGCLTLAPVDGVYTVRIVPAVDPEPDPAKTMHVVLRDPCDGFDSCNKRGDVEMDAGNLDAARALFLEALDIAKRLAAIDPSNAEWQRDLIVSEMRLAWLEAVAQKLVPAQLHLESAKAVLARLDEAGLLRDDVLLVQSRQAIDEFERTFPR
jgi:hypothetical protein